jgi:hypothetical protein
LQHTKKNRENAKNVRVYNEQYVEVIRSFASTQQHALPTALPSTCQDTHISFDCIDLGVIAETLIAEAQDDRAAPQHDRAAPQHDRAAPQHDRAAPQHDRAAPQHAQQVPVESPPPDANATSPEAAVEDTKNEETSPSPHDSAISGVLSLLYSDIFLFLMWLWTQLFFCWCKTPLATPGATAPTPAKQPDEEALQDERQSTTDPPDTAAREGVVPHTESMAQVRFWAIDISAQHCAKNLVLLHMLQQEVDTGIIVEVLAFASSLSLVCAAFVLLFHNIVTFFCHSFEEDVCYTQLIARLCMTVKFQPLLVVAQRVKRFEDVEGRFWMLLEENILECRRCGTLRHGATKR